MRPAHQCCGKLVEVHAGGAWSREPHATPPLFPAPPWYEVYGSATDCRQASASVVFPYCVQHEPFQGEFIFNLCTNFSLIISLR